jgi:hypothetical protein
MNVLMKFLVVVICFLYLTGSVYGDARRRDPFRLSPELFKVTRPEELVTFKGEDLRGLDLPQIEVTGVMIVGGKAMATARIETLGEVVLRPKEKIVVKPREAHRGTLTSFLVKEITFSELVIILEGGREVRGRFR